MINMTCQQPQPKGLPIMVEHPEPNISNELLDFQTLGVVKEDEKNETLGGPGSELIMKVPD